MIHLAIIEPEPMRTLTTNIQVDYPDFDEQIFIIKEVTEVMRRCERALEGKLDIQCCLKMC